jgi:hypothetical protein
MSINTMARERKEITIGELFSAIKSLMKFIYSKWLSIMMLVIFGAILGIVIAFFTPIKYISKLTFVVEESKNVGGGLSALAGQFGFDLGGSGGGVFAGDNILLFLKSEKLSRETMMTDYDEEGKLVLADRYAEVMNFKKKWLKSKKIGEINFAKYKNQNLPRLEDSLLQDLIRNSLLLKDLSVIKPDKKASFVQVSLSTRDEKLSAIFVERLVEIATKKYIDSKVKMKVKNVQILQKRADSLASILNNKTYQSASSQQSLVDVNPAIKTAPILAEINTREKSMIATIFAEVVKNLEIAKTILSQETPSIEIVDQSSLPLQQQKVGLIKSGITWAIFFGLFYVVFITLKRWLSRFK